MVTKLKSTCSVECPVVRFSTFMSSLPCTSFDIPNLIPETDFFRLMYLFGCLPISVMTFTKFEIITFFKSQHFTVHIILTTVYKEVKVWRFS
jgi:hypothetical protein